MSFFSIRAHGQAGRQALGFAGFVAVGILFAAGACLGGRVALAESSAGAPTKKMNKTPEFYIDPGDYILANTLIAVESYDKKTGIYHLKRPDIPDANQLFASLENLVKAVKTLNLEAIKRRPGSIVGNSYSTDNDLRLEPEVPTRVQARSKSGSIERMPASAPRRKP